MAFPLLAAFRLFVEGGNFSSEEVQSFSKCLQKESKSIDSFERSILADMEKMESRCLEQVCAELHSFKLWLILAYIMGFITTLDWSFKTVLCDKYVMEE